LSEPEDTQIPQVETQIKTPEVETKTETPKVYPKLSERELKEKINLLRQRIEQDERN